MIESNKNKLPKARLGKLVIDELSIVDRPCVEPATVMLMKRATDDESHAAAHESPRPPALTRKVSTMTLDEALAEIKDLKAKLAELDKSKEDLEEIKDEAEKRATMTDAQRAHYKTLDKADAKAFLAKSASERDADVTKRLAGDPVEVEFNGVEYRKSSGPAVIELAKAAKAQAEQLAKRDNEIKKARIRKAASEILKNAPGTDATHDFIVEQLEGNADAMATLKGLVATSSIGKSAAGAGGEAIVDTGPQAEFDALVAKHVEIHKCDAGTARLAVTKTERGRALYGEIELLKKRR